MGEMRNSDLVVNRGQSGVDSLVSLARCGIAHSDDLTSGVKKATAASSVNRSTVNIMFFNTVVNATPFIMASSDRRGVATITANRKDRFVG